MQCEKIKSIQHKIHATHCDTTESGVGRSGGGREGWGDGREKKQMDRDF